MPEARPVPISDLIRGLGSLAVTLIVMLALLFWPAGTLARELPGYAEYMQRVRSVGSRSTGEAVGATAVQISLMKGADWRPKWVWDSDLTPPPAAALERLSHQAPTAKVPTACGSAHLSPSPLHMRESS